MDPGAACFKNYSGAASLRPKVCVCPRVGQLLLDSILAAKLLSKAAKFENNMATGIIIIDASSNALGKDVCIENHRADYVPYIERKGSRPKAIWRPAGSDKRTNEKLSK